MNMYSYKKSKDTSNNGLTYSDIYSYIDQTNNSKNISKDFNLINDLASTSKIANFLLPLIFIATGLFFIGRQYYPKIQAYFYEIEGILDKGNTTPVTDDYLNKLQYISNPAGLDELAKDAFDSNILQADTVSQNYNGTFYISIPSIGINRLPVKSNVDSTSESAYQSALKNSLAHFRGTSLPISDVKNNIVIYGHSASSLYNPQKNDPEVAFSFIHEIKVGDEIIIEIEGKEYIFKMTKGNVVLPTDVEIITGQPGKRTLTLFTCWEPGNNSKRYVVTARPV